MTISRPIKLKNAYFIVEKKWLHFALGIVYANKCTNGVRGRVDVQIIRFGVVIMFVMRATVIGRIMVIVMMMNVVAVVT